MVNELLKSLEKKLGLQTVENVDFWETGIASLDETLGGGFPRGRIVEIFGPESGGKTSFMLCLADRVYKKYDKPSLIFDIEYSLSEDWLPRLGISPEAVFIRRPAPDKAYAENILDIIESLVESGEFAFVIVDSLAAMTPKAVLEGSAEDFTIALLARILSSRLGIIAQKAAETDTTVVFINQVRDVIGGYGNSETTPGGRAVKFYASQRVRISAINSTKIIVNGQYLGHSLRIKVEKNKVGVPKRECVIPFLFYGGIDEDSLLLQDALRLGIVEQRGGWYIFGERKFQGAQNFVEALRNDPVFRDELNSKIEQTLKGGSNEV